MTPDEKSRLSAMRKAGHPAPGSEREKVLLGHLQEPLVEQPHGPCQKVAAGIRQRGIRRREFERFISELEKLPEAVSEFDETLWGSLVDYVTVSKDKSMVFTLIGGTEMKA